MTRRYLLFDARCSVCTNLGAKVEQASGGWLMARDLRDPEVQSLLNKARSSWKWEPTLLEVDGDHVKLFTGLGMRARLALGLGPKRTWQVMQIVANAVVPAAKDTPRRAFIRQGAMAIAGTVLGVSSLGSIARAESRGVLLQDLTSEELDTYVKIAQSTQHFQAFARRLGKGDLQPFSLNKEQVRAFKVSDANGAFIGIHFPVQGGAGHSFYGVTVRASTHHVIDERLAIFTTDSSENIVAHLEQNGQSIGVATISKDGKILRKTGKIADESNSTRQSLAVPAAARCDVLCCLNGCLASQGIAAWVITAVGLFCAVACAATFGTGCVVCLVVIAGVANGVANYCVSQCVVKHVPYNGCVGGC